MIRVSCSVILMLFLVATSACGRKDVKRNGEIKMRGEKPVSASDRKPGARLQNGTASWYGKKYHGRKTANGERYDMWAMTAAHKSLEFGTLVKVVNKDNGQSVIVRINDRGPFIRGRIIDLSRGAAREIGLEASGIAPVTLYLAETSKRKPKPDTTSTVYDRDRSSQSNTVYEEDKDGLIYEGSLTEREIPASEGYWTIQVGSFSEGRRAYVFADQMRNWSDNVMVDREGGMSKVRVGRFPTKSKAGALAEELAFNDIPTWIIFIEK